MRRPHHMCSHNPADSRSFVILGGGPTSLLAAETLRKKGFEGNIVIVTDEPHLPYNRIMLSKNIRAVVDDILLRPQSFYAENGIQVICNARAVGLDHTTKTIAIEPTSSESIPPSLSYDALLIATGARARSLQEGPGIPGSRLANIFTLRVPEDATQIAAAVDPVSTRVVIVGSSFIGMEAASYLKKSMAVASLTVIGTSSVPFERILGAEVGSLLESMHRQQGVEFVLNSVVSRFLGEGSVSGVELDNGDVIPADVVILGVGTICNTQFLRDSGVELARDGSILVDETLRVRGVEDIWAAGDVARYPYLSTLAEFNPVRIEHWDVAMQMGIVAAGNMLGAGEAYTRVPFFWTMQYGVSLRYAGFAQSFDQVIIDGSVQEKKFIAYYLKNGHVLAVATLGRDPAAVAFSELVRLGQTPTEEEVKAGIDLVAKLDHVTRIE